MTIDWYKENGSMFAAVFIWFVIGVVVGWAAGESIRRGAWVDRAMVISAGFLGAVAGGLIYRGLNLPYDLLTGSGISAFAGASLLSMALLALRQRAAQRHG
jgi:uncharacterized membrane protein YeaQ/YmgE (transglycosylase-associated protein family)